MLKLGIERICGGGGSNSQLGQGIGANEPLCHCDGLVEVNKSKVNKLIRITSDQVIKSSGDQEVKDKKICYLRQTLSSENNSFPGGKVRMGANGAIGSRQVEQLSDNSLSSYPLTLQSSLKKRVAFTLAEVFSPHFADSRKVAFTLAEVLITLGIIGVVAAMTLPTLIQKHNNIVVESRLSKFYSIVNQALAMAELDYGDKKLWVELDAIENRREHTIIDDSGIGDSHKLNSDPIRYVASNHENVRWFNKYLNPYMKVVKVDIPTDEIDTRHERVNMFAYFDDGSALGVGLSITNDYGWMFYPGNPKKCEEKYGEIGGIGVCKFPFAFFPRFSQPYYKNKGMEPAIAGGWDGDVNKLYTDSTYGCNKNSQYHLHCTAVIRNNGWKIPKNYPFKVVY